MMMTHVILLMVFVNHVKKEKLLTTTLMMMMFVTKLIIALKHLTQINDFNFDNIGDACDGIGINEEKNNKNLITVVDILGREIYNKNNEHKLLLMIFDDGSVEKIIKK